MAQPAFIYARKPSVCSLCHRPIRVGDQVVRYGAAWPHLGCAEADVRLRQAPKP